MDNEHALSLISTRWNLVFEAHGPPGDAAADSQRALLLRYCEATYRYFLKAVRDADTAMDLSQELAVRFMRGDFKRATPERGRFRDFLRTVLYHVLVDYYRKRNAQPQQLPSASRYQPQALPEAAELDRDFISQWRQELLNRAWESLRTAEPDGESVQYQVLRWRADHPKEPAASLAAELSAKQDKTVTDESVRQTLHRARIKFAQLLVEEVRQSLVQAERQQIEEELAELGLLSYCQPVLAKPR